MRASIVAAAWIALIAVYSVALIVNGVLIEFAVRNAVANLLPDALLGLLVLRAPAFRRVVLAQIAMIVAFVVLAFAGWIALIAADSLLFTGHLTVKINVRLIPFKVLIDVLIYGVLAGVAFAMRNAERAAKAEALRAQASLEAMRSQLNPHFILNTFHALVGLVRRDPDVAERALEQLGDLLRYGLRVQRDGIDEVTLREECTFVESYLALERLRLADRLHVKVDAAPATMDFLVPAFAVQVLAENAIRHAIAPRAAGGELRIRVEQTDGRLRVAVEDECATEAVDRSEGSGIGLRLLQERLAALYGSRATLTLRGIAGGTCADLDLPARRVEELA